MREHTQGFIEILNDLNTSSTRSLKMDPYGNMIIFCNCHLNLNHFQIVCHKATSQENVMGFQIQI